MKTTLTYGKEEAKMIAGVAIVMMLVHHFFGFADYRLEGNWFYESLMVGGVSVERIFASAGKLCVAIFSFSSGYAIWVNRESFTRFQSVGKRILKFLLNYWIILGAFLIYGLAIGDKIPEGRELLYNLYGAATGPMTPYVNVAFAWYVVFYVFLLLLTPCLLRLYSRELGGDLVIILGFTLLPVLIKSSFLDKISGVPLALIFGTMISAVIGILVAKWRVFDRMRMRIGGNAFIKGLTIIIGVLIIRQIGLLTIGHTDISEAVFAMLFCFGLLLVFEKIKGSRTAIVLSFLGTYSMNLWFLHGIFFTGSRPFQYLLYMPRISILILIWGLALLLPAAMLFAYIQKHVWRFVTKLPACLSFAK